MSTCTHGELTSESILSILEFVTACGGWISVKKLLSSKWLRLKLWAEVERARIGGHVKWSSWPLVRFGRLAWNGWRRSVCLILLSCHPPGVVSPATLLDAKSMWTVQSSGCSEQFTPSVFRWRPHRVAVHREHWLSMTHASAVDRKADMSSALLLGLASTEEHVRHALASPATGASLFVCLLKCLCLLFELCRFF